MTSEETPKSLTLSEAFGVTLTLFKEVQKERDELKTALRDALGHSCCYCEKCKAMTRKFWLPEGAPNDIATTK